IVLIVSLVNFFLLRPASFYFQNKVLPALEGGYDRFIRFVLKGFAPYLIFGGTFFLLFFAIGLLNSNMPKVEYFPQADPFYINVFVDMPMGSDIEATNRIVKSIEKDVSNAVQPYDKIVDAILTQIGEGTADPSAPPEPGFTPHKARITVAFLPSEERDGISTFQIMEEIRESVQGYPGVVISVDKNQDGPGSGKPINIELVGEDISRLTVLSEEMIAFINAKNIAGIEELKADVRLAKPELIIDVDRERARRYGIATRTIAATIRTALYGSEASKFKDGEDEYPIQVRLDEKYRNNITDLLNQKILWRSQSNGDLFEIPISAVANVRYTTNYSSIKRKDLDKAITVYSNVLKGYNANEIVARIKSVMKDFEMPRGYTFEFTGEQQEQQEDMAFLNTAFMVALFSIFLILVAQFNSVVKPFIIVLSILFSTIGVFLGYATTGMDLIVIMTGIGIISLAGIVVNNAIVLIDYIDLTRKRQRTELGLNKTQELDDESVKTSIVEGGKTRLRPVLLTAITTIMGLVPLAIGFNINFFTFVSRLDAQFFIGGDNVSFWGPMAWTVIYGLTFATFLTLVVVPVMYWLFYKWVYTVQNWFGRAPQKVGPVEDH
ncbi:MAG: efflux RND transporter permease subunit, partial [Bacteroidota bacterium]